MTELEMHLLNALEQLQQDYMQRLKDWESAFTDLQHMFELTRQENGQLREQCDDLSQQVQRLAGQVDRLSRLFITNSR
ncbi:MbeD family mobilization/exclusion protein [Escherichia coli]|uniref:MbeD family mobilization/exclusion protein n=2 Tax=Escherichia coli TaxID=562 RepID=A0AAN3H5V7_ECOLX|nr:MbeD family mobilization/exclusion protein [Escherichia coli]EER0315716.1 MbeD family mobilization/exclusion protein [Escherichia coli]EER0906894.1 MbeD family mobilization/exclusion protein [Escherichia coli]EES9076953.1 MbeD family mobilization/exclusion protein [Escherichia coli]EEW1262780.1 MbeD family mobilization/exclusion protein [Escherichia coli]EEW4722815.1 MbeD family mobilization/exclusion protein [Escherichia coli]